MKFESKQDWLDKMKPLAQATEEALKEMRKHPVTIEKAMEEQAKLRASRNKHR